MQRSAAVQNAKRAPCALNLRPRFEVRSPPASAFQFIASCQFVDWIAEWQIAIKDFLLSSMPVSCGFSGKRAIRSCPGASPQGLK
jgi:hypothetical protein